MPGIKASTAFMLKLLTEGPEPRCTHIPRITLYLARWSWLWRSSLKHSGAFSHVVIKCERHGHASPITGRRSWARAWAWTVSIPGPEKGGLTGHLGNTVPIVRPLQIEIDLHHLSTAVSDQDRQNSRSKTPAPPPLSPTCCCTALHCMHCLHCCSTLHCESL